MQIFHVFLAVVPWGFDDTRPVGCRPGAAPSRGARQLATNFKRKLEKVGSVASACLFFSAVCKVGYPKLCSHLARVLSWPAPALQGRRHECMHYDLRMRADGQEFRVGRRMSALAKISPARTGSGRSNDPASMDPLHLESPRSKCASRVLRDSSTEVGYVMYCRYCAVGTLGGLRCAGTAPFL